MQTGSGTLPVEEDLFEVALRLHSERRLGNSFAVSFAVNPEKARKRPKKVKLQSDQNLGKK